MKRNLFELCKLNKRIIVVILPALIMSVSLFLSGCNGYASQNHADESDEIYLYYVLADETGIASVPFERPQVDTKELDEAQSYEKIVEAWIDALSGVPKNPEYKSPIDNGMGANSITFLSGIVTLDFDPIYYQTESIAEVLRRAAIVKTLIQIDGINGIAFTVEGNPLNDSKQSPVGVMTENTFVSNPGAEINSYETTTIQVYFADEAGENLIGRTENVGYISNISMERLVVDRVIAGPLNDKSYPTVSSALKVLNVTTKDGVCYVNFDNSFLTKTQKVSDEVVIYSFVNSLTELPNVSKVQFMVDSESEVSFGEHIYLSEPFERNLEIVTNKE